MQLAIIYLYLSNILSQMVCIESYHVPTQVVCFYGGKSAVLVRRKHILGFASRTCSVPAKLPYWMTCWGR